MPRSIRISDEERDTIAKTAFALKADNPKTSLKEIAKVVKRDDSTIWRVMSDKKFDKYRDEFKKKIDQIRFQAIAEGDLQVLQAVKDQQIKPYQLIGMSKTYYEQSFGLNEGNGVHVSGNQVAVQVVRGNVSHNNTKGNTEPE